MDRNSPGSRSNGKSDRVASATGGVCFPSPTKRRSCARIAPARAPFPRARDSGGRRQRRSTSAQRIPQSAPVVPLLPEVTGQPQVPLDRVGNAELEMLHELPDHRSPWDGPWARGESGGTPSIATVSWLKHGFRRHPQHEVEVVRHDDKGQQLHTELGQGATQMPEHGQVRAFGFQVPCAPVDPRGHVPDRVGRVIFASGFHRTSSTNNDGSWCQLRQRCRTFMGVCAWEQTTCGASLGGLSPGRRRRPASRAARRRRRRRSPTRSRRWCPPGRTCWPPRAGRSRRRPTIEYLPKLCGQGVTGTVRAGRRRCRCATPPASPAERGSEKNSSTSADRRCCRRSATRSTPSHDRVGLAARFTRPSHFGQPLHRLHARRHRHARRRRARAPACTCRKSS